MASHLHAKVARHKLSNPIQVPTKPSWLVSRLGAAAGQSWMLGIKTSIGSTGRCAVGCGPIILVVGQFEI